jgi:glycosyltransferase involved in cell wall biosynthesis
MLTYISFSRNFGHQQAIKAGIDHANADAVIIMDADLQQPPELIPEFIKFGKKVMMLSIRGTVTVRIKLF